jgi:hypothetical protein
VTICFRMVITLEKSRHRHPRNPLSFATRGQLLFQLAALMSASALVLLVAKAANDTFMALVAAFQQSTPMEWMSANALITTVWVLTFAGSALLLKWAWSRALATVLASLARRGRFQSEAYFGPGLKGRSRLDS